MKNTFKNIDKISEMIHHLQQKGCSEKSSFFFLASNPELTNLSVQEFQNKVSIIYNYYEVYAILFCNGNEYWWSYYKDDEFGPLTSVQPEQKNNDYIIELVLSFIQSDKIRKFVDFDESDTLEEKINAFRDVRTNDQGYHLH